MTYEHEGVYITKEGFVITKWDKDERKYRPIKQENEFIVVRHLRSTCLIEEGVTLGNIFNAVSKNEALMLFIGLYAWCDMDAFHEEAKSPIEGGDSDLTELRLSKYFIIEDAQAYETINFNGVGPSDENPKEIIDNWALDFTPVNKLAPLPVKLNPNILVRDEREIDGKYAPSRTIAEVSATFSLLEVLSEIYWEISFHGSPQDRTLKNIEINTILDEFHKGELKTKPWSELKKKLEGEEHD